MTSPTTDTPAPTFDADAWLAGSKPAAAFVTLRQRPDLVAVVQDLQHRLNVAEAVPDDARDDDETPDDLHRQLAALHEQWDAASLRVTVEARSSHAIEAVRKALPRSQRDDDEEITLHRLADAIVEPTGITPEWLRTFRELHPAQYLALIVTSARVNTQTPDLPAARP